MVEAAPYLADPFRIRTTKGDTAQTQISILIQLYQRKPGMPSNLAPYIPAPANYVEISNMLESHIHPSARVLSSIPSSPPMAPTHFTAFGLDGPGSDVPHLTPSSSTSTNVTSVSSDSPEVDADFYIGADVKLLEYAREEAVTWEDLRTRPPLFGGEDVGKYRYASVDEICRSKT
jgi:hypothetical protein